MNPKRLVLYVAALALGIYLLARWDASKASDVGTYVEQAERALEAGKAFRARSDSLRRVSQDAQKRAQDALGRANTLSSTIRRLQLTLPTDSGAVSRGLVDSLLTAAEARDSARLVAIHSLETAVGAERARADSAESRVKKLEGLVATSIPLVECRLLSMRFLPRCPSRITSLVLGVGVGAAGVLLAK